jgi:segregation and condensation protein B
MSTMAPSSDPVQILEAALFVGGPPLPLERMAAVLKLPVEIIQAHIDTLQAKYAAQRRPYRILRHSGGYTLAIQPEYRNLRERLFGGPREARLSQPALDVLSLVAYQQPITKAEIDSLRGHDSAAILRQLVRLGLATVSQRASSGDATVRYGTTAKFLRLFQLESLDDLPQLGAAE